MKYFVPSLRLCVFVLLITICKVNVAQAQVQVQFQSGGSLGLSEPLFVGDYSFVYFESGVYSAHIKKLGRSYKFA